MAQLPRFIIPKVSKNDLLCNCGIDDSGFKPFWMHKETCNRYILITGGFHDTAFEDKEIEAQRKEKFGF